MKKNKQIIYELILWGLLAFGILGSGSLVYSEFMEGHICPLLLGIPACYIIFICFLFLTFLHFFRAKNYYFYGLALFPITIALYGSFFQIFGTIECPKTESGIPMCFISLGLFSSLVVCKYIMQRKK